MTDDEAKLVSAIAEMREDEAFERARAMLEGSGDALRACTGADAYGNSAMAAVSLCQQGLAE